AGGDCGLTLAVGASCTVNVVFSPAAPIAYSGQLTVAGTGATVIPASVPLSGSGTATFTAGVSPSALAFGNVVVGNTSSSKTVTVTNTGNSALGGLTYSFDASQYSRPADATGGTCGATLAVGASCTVNVVYAPTTATSSPGNLTITGTT